MKKSLLMLFAMLVSSASAFAGIRVADVTTTAGSTVEVAVLFENEANISWFNFNVSLPGGFTTVKDASGNLDCALGFNGTNHVIEYGTNGRVEIVESAYGAIPSNCKLVTFKFKVGATVKDDYYTGKITNISYVGTNHAGGTKGDVSFTIKVGDAKYDFKDKINVKFDASFKGYDWTGAQIKPGVDADKALNTFVNSVTWNGKVLKEGRDFEINYKTLAADANIDAGTGKIFFVGMGDYKTDTTKVDFPILKVDPEYKKHGISTMSKTYLHALAYDSKLKVTYEIAADSVQQIAKVDTLVAAAVGGKIAWSMDGVNWFNQDDFQDDKDLSKKDAKTRGQKFDEKMKATLVGAKAGYYESADNDTRYKVYYKVKGDKNHNDLVKKGESYLGYVYVSIWKASAQFAPVLSKDKKSYVKAYPEALDYYWDGQSHALLTSPGVTYDGTFEYQLNYYQEYSNKPDDPWTFVDVVTNDTWSTSIPQGTDAGWYHVLVKIKGDANHTDSYWGGGAYIDPAMGATYDEFGNKLIVIRVGEYDKAKSEIVSVEATNANVAISSAFVKVRENAFAGTTGVTDIYLTGNKTIALENGSLTIPDGVATIHTPIALLGDYALNAVLKDNFDAGKVQSDIYLRKGYNTFSSSVDVLVPDVVDAVYTATTNADGVLLNEVLDLDVYGEDAILTGNGVILESSAWGTVPFVAWNGRMLSNDAPVKSKQMDYGVNELVPVFDATHFDPATVYVLNNNQFKAVKDDDATNVPAGKAVLLSAVELAARTLDILNADVTGISELQNDDKAGEIYNLQGARVNTPAKKGLYIINGKKVMVK